MIVKWEGPERGSSTHHDDVETCRTKRMGDAVCVDIVLRNGVEMAFEVVGNVFVMNDAGVTIDKVIVQ